MLATFAFAFLAVHTPSSLPHVNLAVVRNVGARTQFVRITSEIDFSGVHGREIETFDLGTGNYVDHISAGVLSSSGGFDGKRSWGADATGMALVDDSVDGFHDELAWAHFYGRRGPEAPTIRPVRDARGILSLRLRYSDLSGPIDVQVAHDTGRVTTIVDRSGVDAQFARFADYRRVAGFLVPFISESSSRFGIVRERAVKVEQLVSIPVGTFAPPAAPNDTTLLGRTSLPMRLLDDAPVVAVRVDGGPVLHVLFDSGSGNSLTSRAARRLGLRLVGRDESGGVGAGLARTRYALVKRLQIGRAVFRNQLFSVLDLDEDDGLDGIVGCEVLERVVVRFDFARKTIELARYAATLRPRGTPVAMRLPDCQPEVDGVFERIPGNFSIDTGSGVALDIMSPFVRRYGLLRRYHAKVVDNGSGFGGRVRSGLAVARSVRIGGYDVSNVPIGLSAMSTGAFADPTEIANVGVPLLRHFVITFDYRNHRMWFARNK